MGIIQGTALLAAYAQSFFLDKIDRVTAVILGFTMAAIGYLALGFIGDPFSDRALFAGFLLGLGETATIITGNALIGQSAPSTHRGAVLGVFALSGAMGILVATLLGGRLFDLWMPGGPFVQMGVINTLIVLFALFVRFRTRGPR